MVMMIIIFIITTIVAITTISFVLFLDIKYIISSIISSTCCFHRGLQMAAEAKSERTNVLFRDESMIVAAWPVCRV